ncbi:hypothetical protein MHEL_37420 [Mycolicibacterium helvum]|uniref:Uncharacterized protein n=1 Tax=Mycolicibacterium helvum TaxID=1534349 RepID=A0A7I7TAM4_9MYCO|nr:hypothetical protein MHEL_37420 [Mycolicibacterium helvum]
MVVPGGVEDELAEEFPGGGVDGSDGEVLDEDQGAASVVDAADADVVQAAVDARLDCCAEVFGSEVADVPACGWRCGVVALCWSAVLWFAGVWSSTVGTCSPGRGGQTARCGVGQPD